MAMSILKLRNLSALRSAANSARIGVSSRGFSKLAEGTDITSAAPGVSLQKARSWDEGVSSKFSTTPLSDIFKGKKVVIFGLPGAYTGVCSQQHVPSYKSHIDKFKAKGIDSVICVSVNDPFAINGWAEKLGAKDAVSSSIFFLFLSLFFDTNLIRCLVYADLVLCFRKLDLQHNIYYSVPGFVV
ncbi:peroxiredoxin IIF [Arabidopsis thaliana]|uniref:glutaredoxin-dependent peroxiredoxin n=1 Tax=Arabidopsis thaliana TaxID=3702 RepID=A0A1I9LRF4_ARATH|nr:peroxiredoxin IIF [Arabidopsis thaliana]ANM65162.1 peroxiredoxin IIF [Arabidopsis thaliana]|eukprot:NP_001327152.1 peroxiredoxin IIF [Arabidopsis thaliana]